MSRLADYSKFDHLTEDSDDEGHDNNDAVEKNNKMALEATTKAAPVAASNQSANATNRSVGGRIRRDESSGRYHFEHNGRTVYEFEQSLDDVTIYIVPPPYVTRGHQINCTMSANHFKLGLVGHCGGESGNESQWFLNEDTYGTVDVDESTWTLEDYDGGVDDGAIRNNNSDRKKIIVVTLIKANRGTMWEAALKGNAYEAGARNTTKTSATAVTSTVMDSLSKEQVKKDLMLQRFQEENPGFDFTGADFNGSIPNARDFMGGVKY